MKDERWKDTIEAVGRATFEQGQRLSPEERARVIARMKAGEPPPKTYAHGWSEGREFQMQVILLHLHARGFCEAAKAMEAPGFFGSFGMAGSDHFAQEAFEQTHVCKPKAASEPTL